MICNVLFIVGIILLILLLLFVINLLSESTSPQPQPLQPPQVPQSQTQNTSRLNEVPLLTYEPSNSQTTQTTDSEPEPPSQSYLQMPNPIIPNDPPKPALPMLRMDICPALPKNTTRSKRQDITDWGWIDSKAGYYDICNTGQCVDYCRTTGAPGQTFFSCALGGDSRDQYAVHITPDAAGPKCGAAPPAAVTPVTKESLASFCATLPKNAPRRSDITDLGFADDNRGWYNLCNRPACNDFCRTVGQPGGYYIACALAGAKGDQYATVIDPSILEGQKCAAT